MLLKHNSVVLVVSKESTHPLPAPVTSSPTDQTNYSVSFTPQAVDGPKFDAFVTHRVPNVMAVRLDSVQTILIGKWCTFPLWYLFWLDQMPPILIGICMVHIPHRGPETYMNMWQKVRRLWIYAFHQYEHEYDWFHMGSDDMYAFVENLKEYLKSEEIQMAAKGQNNNKGASSKGTSAHQHIDTSLFGMSAPIVWSSWYNDWPRKFSFWRSRLHAQPCDTPGQGNEGITSLVHKHRPRMSWLPECFVD